MITVFKYYGQSLTTLAKTELIHPKNVGTSVAMNFTWDKYSAQFWGKWAG